MDISSILRIITRNSLRRLRSRDIIKFKKSGATEFIFEPWFNTIEELFYGKITKGSMCHAVFKNEKFEKEKFNNIHLAIQCDKSVSTQESGLYSTNELFFLKLICQAVATCIEKIIQNLQMKNAIDRTVEAMKLFKGISTQINLASICASVEEIIPKIFKAK